MIAHALAVSAFLSFFLFNTPVEAPWWKVQTSGINTNLRGVSAVYVWDANGARVPVVWASGSNGVILRSLDEGKTWKRLYVAGGERLDFRGIVAFGEKTVYAMSSGEGENSRIYKTTDGGETWNLQFTGNRKEFFLDSIACISEKDCVALGDPIDGKFLLLKMADGKLWTPLPTNNMPTALRDEGAFAASNSCLLLSRNEILFGTGGATVARVFHSRDGGLTWTVAETPLANGNASSGIFSLAFASGARVIAVGGDYKNPKRSDRVAAYSLDGGTTWQLASRQPGGFRSAVASNQLSIFALGPNGQELSEDRGVRWDHTDSLNLNAVVMLDILNGWAVGPTGTIARFLNHNAAEVRYRRRHGRQRSSASAIAD